MWNRFLLWVTMLLCAFVVSGRAVAQQIKASQISAGMYHTLVVRADGVVFAWGDNTYGELGNNSTTISLTPVQVNGLSNVVAVAAGTRFSVALKSDGTVVTWGINSSGQLGNGTTTNSAVPVQVAGLSNIVAIAANLTTGQDLSLSFILSNGIWTVFNFTLPPGPGGYGNNVPPTVVLPNVNFYPQAVNIQTCAIGYDKQWPQGEFWNGIGIIPLGAQTTPVALNDQNVVVGYSNNNNTITGLMWNMNQQGAPTPTQLQSLVPAPLTKLIQNIQPLFLSNVNASNIVSIICTAQIWEGSPKPTWTTENVLFQVNANNPTLNPTVQIAVMPATVQSLRCINSSSVIAAYSNTSNATGTSHALLLLPVTFTVVNFAPTKDPTGAGVAEPWTSSSSNVQYVHIDPGTIRVPGTTLNISITPKSVPQSIRDQLASNYRFGLIQKGVPSMGCKLNFRKTVVFEVAP